VGNGGSDEEVTALREGEMSESLLCKGVEIQGWSVSATCVRVLSGFRPWFSGATLRHSGSCYFSLGSPCLFPGTVILTHSTIRLRVEGEEDECDPSVVG